ncbi:cyclic nucleotide-binding domain-containing protein [Amycolatopsis rifamycinica]|uniref:Crp/Fnr family transcriptional regulator n=1 Tax=Amycolatopsis rifamycinica TaxID=287986 RepID=A0A066U3U0_9PSEU|nr:cyclic nucleotide-binding domain-containing protein [Amycolatopsis rifamycinica]KDN22121.1 hypothetical protein DV20_12115 [Amycolatopsis rifamycinica]
MAHLPDAVVVDCHGGEAAALHAASASRDLLPYGRAQLSVLPLHGNPEDYERWTLPWVHATVQPERVADLVAGDVRILAALLANGLAGTDLLVADPMAYVFAAEHHDGVLEAARAVRPEVAQLTPAHEDLDKILPELLTAHPTPVARIHDVLVSDAHVASWLTDLLADTEFRPREARTSHSADAPVRYQCPADGNYVWYRHGGEPVLDCPDHGVALEAVPITHRVDAGATEQQTTPSQAVPQAEEPRTTTAEAEEHGPPDGALAAIPAKGALLAYLADADRDYLLARGVRRRFRANDVMIMEGDSSDHVLVLVSGWVRVSTIVEDGREVLFGLRGPGEVLGDFAAVTGSARTATVRAIEPCTVIQLTGAEFVGVLRARPEIAIAVIKTVAARLRNAELARIESAAFDVSRRVASHLVRLAEEHGRTVPEGVVIEVALSQVDIAAQIGAARQTVARTLRGLRERGIVETGRRRILIRELRVLRAFARSEPKAETIDRYPQAPALLRSLGDAAEAPDLDAAPEQHEYARTGSQEAPKPYWLRGRDADVQPERQQLRDLDDGVRWASGTARPERRIFLCYRADDEQFGARLVDSELAREFGSDTVFFGSRSLAAGGDWRRDTFEAVASSSVLLVLIGQHWLTAADERGHRRLDDPDDFVRREIELGFELGKRIIPVYLGRSPLTPDELPASLRTLATIPGITIEFYSRESGIARLVAQLRQQIPSPSK